MNLAPTPEQQELQASARRFLEKEITRERLLAWDKTAEGYDAAFWRAVVDLGWLSFSLPEPAGGGADLLDMALILEECGRALAPAAIHAAVVGARALAALGRQAAQGLTTVALHERDNRASAGLPATRIEGDKLFGEKWYVRQGVTADSLIVLASERGEPVLVLVAAGAPGMSRRELKTFGGDRQSVVRFDGVAVSPQARVASGAAARAALRRIEQEAAALALAEIVGGFAAVCEMTVAYMKERVQFNQPLGKFQAVQFRCADMATALSGTRHLAFSAIWSLAEGQDANRELSIARAWAGGAYKQATLDAHQLHGGAGYVVEHPLHRYAERAQSYAILFASEDDALTEVADRLLNQKGEGR
jgi:alkylation response protein AidB-like acyl-CoA dehydrogenase